MFEQNTLTSEQDAHTYINKYGVVTLFPVKGWPFPNLYEATKGSHQQKFENAWKWADELGYKKQIHYGKLVRRQVTFFSLEVFPCFYKLCRTAPLNKSAQQILDFIDRNGPSSTTVLRKNSGLWGKEKKNDFVKAMDQLQMAFAVVIVSREKPPKMTHIYDITEKVMPKALLQKGKSITTAAAKEKIGAKMLKNGVISNIENLKQILPR